MTDRCYPTRRPQWRLSAPRELWGYSSRRAGSEGVRTMVGEAGSFERFLICNDSLAALLGRHPHGLELCGGDR